MPSNQQPPNAVDRNKRTITMPSAPKRHLSAWRMPLQAVFFSALFSLLSACSSLKEINPIPERWRGGGADASMQSPELGARSRLQGVFSPYRTTVQQGNYITQEQLEQVRLGMTRNQVQFVLGQPLMNNSFRQDRWVYVFRMQWPDLRHDTRRVSVFFDEQQRVARLESDTLPPRDDGKDPAVPGYRPPRANDR